MAGSRPWLRYLQKLNISVCASAVINGRRSSNACWNISTAYTWTVTYSIVVVDNDHLKSSKSVVSGFSAASTVPVKYCVEPQQNIPMARNKAVENADGEFSRD
jgi:hypothetical protein